MTTLRSNLLDGGVPALGEEKSCASALPVQNADKIGPCLPTSSSDPQPPPKKKKKYTPKPKKSPQLAAGTVGGTEASKPPAKSKQPSKPKALRKRPTSGGGGGSARSKSKKGKKPPPLPGTNAIGIADIQEGNIGGAKVEGESSRKTGRGVGQRQLVPPLKLTMPKLTRMPGALLTPIVPPSKMSDDLGAKNGENLDPLMLTEAEMNEDGVEETGNGKGSSRKKKSKGRNGNIYIGVFNRIEWMKLQNEFGFGSVNNFGTFVLQTMRRVHGDVQFWCGVAEASGVYPDLDHYEWTNGFPHAINKEGQPFTPEPDVTISDEKREDVIELAKGMWEQRLQQLKQQQQELTGEEEVELVDGEDDDEEDDDAMPGLEKYLENMASGQYSPLAVTSSSGGKLQQSSGGGDKRVLTEEQVNKVWNEQMKDSDSLKHFGKLFNYVNSIGSVMEGVKEEDGI